MKIINIPNIITSMNLLCGVLGVIFTLEGRIDIAFYLMIAGAVCDFFDGLAARALGGNKAIGKELDSLADVVSFGVLPSIMLYQTMLNLHIEPKFLAYIPLTLAIFSALRLAKFNTDSRQTENFIGLATPASAMICGSLAYYVFNVSEGVLIVWARTPLFIPILVIVISALLISEIPMFSMKFKKGGTASPNFTIGRVLFFIVFLISTLIISTFSLNWSLIVFITFISYVIINLIMAIVKKFVPSLPRK